MLTPPLKLNLGSGVKRIDGFLNVDHSAECNPDIVLDLETFPWAFNSDSVVHVVMNHSLEHVGQTPEKFLQIMQELYRVCRHDAVLDITVPNPFHDSFTADPTHVRPILPLTLALFDRQRNLEWRAENAPNSPLALQCDVDFRISKLQQRVAKDAEKDMAELRKRDPFLADMFLKYGRNIIASIYVRLRVHKQ